MGRGMVGRSLSQPGEVLQAVDSLREGMASLAGETLSGVLIHHDKDSVYTSHVWLYRLPLEEGTRLSYAQRGAKDYPWIESFWGGLRPRAAN
jgi:hypothetical protein